MPITSSTIAWDRPQRDGRRDVREQHTDHNGVQHHVDYLAEPAMDVNAVMTARASYLSTVVDAPPPPEPVPDAPPAYSGSGVPASAMGAVGSCYLDTATGDLYQRTA